MHYDYLVVGAGLFGATFAYEANKAGKKCLVIDKRSHIGGNCYTQKLKGIDIHKYGAHIFHTSNKKVWDWINQFGEFNNFVNSPIAIANGQVYNLPFNMNMFSRLFGITQPYQAKEFIEDEIAQANINNPQNLEEQAISLVGRTIYEMFIKGYTEKQWGKKCTELPASIIKRIPLRFTYDNNYFNDKYQGIPKDGYTNLFSKMLKGIEVRLDTSFKDLSYETIQPDSAIYTGMIDEFFNYKYGKLDYRSLEFGLVEYETANFQGNAVVNYPDKDVHFTRTIEHKHFNKDIQSRNTFVSYEYPEDYDGLNEPYYPINDDKNNALYLRYKREADRFSDITFAGRLGEYKYYDMDDTIESALELVKRLI